MGKKFVPKQVKLGMAEGRSWNGDYIVMVWWEGVQCKEHRCQSYTQTVPAQHNTRHKANVRQTDGR